MEPGALLTAHLSQGRVLPSPHALAGLSYRAGCSDLGMKAFGRRRATPGDGAPLAAGAAIRSAAALETAPGSRPAAGRVRSGGRDPAADPTRAAEAVRVRSCRLACDQRLTRSAQLEVQTPCLPQVASWRRSARQAAGPCGPLAPWQTRHVPCASAATENSRRRAEPLRARIMVT